MKFSLLFIFLLTVISGFSQTTIEGRVYDSLTSKPLEGASITIKDSGIGTTSDKEGFFFLSGEPLSPDAVLQITMIGYSRKVFRVGDFKSNSRVSLSPLAFILDEVLITSSDANSIVAKAFKNLPKNYSLTDFNMLCYYTSKQIVDGEVVDFNDGVVDIPDGGFDNKKTKPIIKPIKGREMKYKDKKGFKNWLDDSGTGALYLLQENNYVKTRNSLLDKKSKYQMDSLYKTSEGEVYAISTYQKPYYLAADPKQAMFTAQLFITSKDHKIFRIYEEEGVKEENNVKSIQWKKATSKEVVSAITYQKSITEYREWNGKLYLFSVYSECHINDFSVSTGKVIHENKYISTLTVNEIYPGVKSNEQKQLSYTKNYWEGYILRRGINGEFFK